MNYLKSVWNFYKRLFYSSRYWVLAAVAIFLVTAYTGVVAYLRYPGLINSLIDYLQSIAGPNPEINNQLVWAIFFQNIRSAFIALFGGVLVGLVPIFVVAVNGFVLGYVESYFYSILHTNLGSKLLIMVATILPHGIFELPIILVSAALGMRLGLGWLASSAAGERRKHFWQDLLLCVKFVPLLVVVLTIAAFLEVYVSAVLARMLEGTLGR